MIRKIHFILPLLFVFGLMAQNSPTIKEQATGIKHTIVETDTLKSTAPGKKVEKAKTMLSDEAIEKEIQRRVDEKIKKITEEKIQKRVDAELKKRAANKKAKSTTPATKVKKTKKIKNPDKPKKIKQPKSKIKGKSAKESNDNNKAKSKIKKKMKKPKSKVKAKGNKGNASKVKKPKNNSFKEILYAEELYNKGNHKKARSFLNVLKHDKDKKLAEEAHYLLLKQYSNVFVPDIYRSVNYNKVLGYKNNADQFEDFKKKYPKSKNLTKLKLTMKEKLAAFNIANEKRNLNLVDLKDSCNIEYKGDSTYTCIFQNYFKDKSKKRHNVVIKISGKITKYDPSGDMHDEWDTSGLLIDNASLIEVFLDKKPMIKFKNPIVHKQNPEYELRRVVEYGFSQNKTCVKEHKVENMINLATYLGEKFIISNLEVKTHFGKMNELASMDVVYAAKPNGNFFSDRFNSKCYIEFALDEK